MKEQVKMSAAKTFADHETHSNAGADVFGINWKRVGVYLAMALALLIGGGGQASIDKALTRGKR